MIDRCYRIIKKRYINVDKLTIIVVGLYEF